MARASSVSRPRGYKPYVYRELEEFHLNQFRQFLRFLYSEYPNRLSFWGDLLPLILDLSAERFQSGKGDPLNPPDWNLDKCLSFRDNLRKQFLRMVEDTKKSPGFLVPERQALYLRQGEYPGLGEVFHLSYRAHSFDPKELQQTIARNVARHLQGLRKDALRTCEVCDRYFLRMDIREVRYCSPICRYRAIDQRRKGQRTSRKKKT